MGWRAVNDAMQIMGGEGYMTENEVERIFRDSRINLIVEGANEVMQSFIFAYGGKQLAEKMLGVQQALFWRSGEGFGANFSRIVGNLMRPVLLRAAVPLGMELFLGVRRRMPSTPNTHPALQDAAAHLCRTIQEHSHQFKMASKRYKEAIITRQAVQARVADAAVWLHAWACTLSKLDLDLRSANGHTGDAEFERNKAAAFHFFELAENAVHVCFRELYENADDTMLKAAETSLRYTQTLPNADFSLPEKSPLQGAQGSGRVRKQDGIKQFPGDSLDVQRRHDVRV
jgi:hypothetical protein